MDLRRLLQVHTRWNLRSTPRAQVKRMEKFKKAFRRFRNPGRTTHGTVAGGFVHCSCGDTVWRRGPLGHGHVWAIQGRAAAAGPAVAARGAQPRYFQPGLPPAGPAGVRGRIPPVHGRLRQGQRTGTARCGGGGWQSLARCLRAWPAKHPAAHGQRLGSGGANVLGSAQSSRPQRGSGGVGSPGLWTSKAVSLPRMHCTPSRLCLHGARAGCGLRAGAQGEPEQVVRCGRSALCAQRSPQRCRRREPATHDRCEAARNRPARYHFRRATEVPRRRCAGPHHLAPPRARCLCGASPGALLPALQIYPRQATAAHRRSHEGSRTSCLAYSMSSSTRIATELAKTTRPRTLLSSESSPSIWSAVTPRPRPCARKSNARVGRRLPLACSVKRSRLGRGVARLAMSVLQLRDPHPQPQPQPLPTRGRGAHRACGSSCSTRSAPSCRRPESSAQSCCR